GFHFLALERFISIVSYDAGRCDRTERSSHPCLHQPGFHDVEIKHSAKSLVGLDCFWIDAHCVPHRRLSSMKEGEIRAACGASQIPSFEQQLSTIQCCPCPYDIAHHHAARSGMASRRADSISGVAGCPS